MTTCSNHPGTIAGADLKRLLEEADRLAGPLRRHVDALARSRDLDFSSYSLLTRIAGETVADEGEALQALLARGLVSAADDEGPVTLLPAGAQLIAEISGELCAWLDKLAAGNTGEDFRSLAEQLRAVRQRIA